MGTDGLLVIVAGGLFWLIFSNLTGFYDALLSLFDILSPILYGCLFAYLMNPIMERTRALLEKIPDHAQAAGFRKRLCAASASSAA